MKEFFEMSNIMPPTKRKAPGKGKGRKGAKRRMYGKKRAMMTEFASASQTLQLSNDANNTVYRYDTCRLAAFDRLVLIAQAYQYYRITKIEMKFKPFYDTFATPETAATATVPYFHWLINRGDNIDLNSFNALRDAGAKPIRFDDKTITVRWKPSVLNYVRDMTSSGTAQPVFNQGRISPWLATNQNAGLNSPTWTPSAVEHIGILYGVEADYAPQQLYYGTEVTVHVQFKKPLNQPGTPLNVVPAVQKETKPKDQVDVSGTEVSA